ncbi:hypothetical protein LLEC1_01818 [Akanthomyces lecanii]|uniref:Uncharacterized protein n=1 Tax=Cordyceps confragosa TaxID=2714763 RepID=A0A179I733_CORDF|nr:hypothetical protein LLEC1_01818 [Akanthomyces lecanii]
MADPRDTVLDTDSLPDDSLYRIRRYISGRAAVVSVYVSTANFLGDDDRTYGPGIIRRLSQLEEWRRSDWKALAITLNAASTLQIDVDAFPPHAMSATYIYGCYPLFDVLELKRQHCVKVRTRHCLNDAGAEVYLKLARFEFEVGALEREVRMYYALRGSALSPALLGYVFEDTRDRIVGFIIDKLVGRYPASAEDCAACASSEAVAGYISPSTQMQ